MWRKRRTRNWNHCPVCGSWAIDGDNIEIEDRWAYQRVSCSICGATWGEEYIANSRYDIEEGDER